MSFDLIVKGGTALTMVPGAEPIADAAVAVTGGEIVEIGPVAEVEGEAQQVVDAGGGLILPGFVNTHTHLAMSLMRGLADDLPLKEWLEDIIWPTERRVMNASAVALGTRWAAVESLKAGVTCVCDMYFFADEIIAAIQEVGLRGVIPEALIDAPTPSCDTPEQALWKQRELLEKYRNHPTVTPAVAAHAPYSVSAANLVKEAELADEFDAPLTIHVAETRWELESTREKHGVSPVAYLAQLGILGDRTVASHCVHVSDEDLDLLAEFGVGVASDPVSNLKLGNGIPPVPMMLEHGVAVGMATDGVACNNTLDLLRDVQLTALLFKGIMGDPTVLPARTMAHLLTLGGAEVLGLSDRIGSLEKGKRADVVCLGVDSPNAVPFYDPFSHLIYSARAADVRHVLVDGKAVVLDGEFTTVDEVALRQEVRTAASEIAQN